MSHQIDPVAAAKSKLGVLCRRKASADQIEAAKTELTAAKMEKAIAEALAAFPPLTPEQKQSAIRLLSTGGAN